MTAEIQNLDQIRANLSQQLITLREEIQLGTIPKENLRDLLLATIYERELLLNEIDSLKDTQNSLYSRSTSYIEPKSLLILSEIDENLFNDFHNFAIRHQRASGEILSHLMVQFLSKFDNQHFPKLSAIELSQTLMKLQPRLEVSHHENLKIVDSDLEELDLKVNFTHIDSLELDLSPEVFISSINQIKHCKIVKIPSSVPKLLAYAKISNCYEIHLLSESKQCLDYAKEANQVVEEWKNGK